MKRKLITADKFIALDVNELLFGEKLSNVELFCRDTFPCNSDINEIKEQLITSFVCVQLIISFVCVLLDQFRFAAIDTALSSLFSLSYSHFTV
jgi:hypothetical protein